MHPHARALNRPTREARISTLCKHFASHATRRISLSSLGRKRPPCSAESRSHLGPWAMSLCGSRPWRAVCLHTFRGPARFWNCPARLVRVSFRQATSERPYASTDLTEDGLAECTHQSKCRGPFPWQSPYVRNRSCRKWSGWWSDSGYGGTRLQRHAEALFPHSHAGQATRCRRARNQRSGCASIEDRPGEPKPREYPTRSPTSLALKLGTLGFWGTQVIDFFGSSGRTRTYNPSVNSRIATRTGAKARHR